MPKTPAHVRLARKYGQTAVLYAALALSAPGEYALAQMAGWDARFAWLMPAVMSLYAAIGASVAKAQKEAARVAVGTRYENEAKRRSRNATIGALLALLMATAAQVTEHVITATVFGPTLWVVVVVSAVPPLVAAHVLHIDPPADDAVDDEPRAPEWVREELERRAQADAGEPFPELEQEDPTPVAEEPQEPVLVTYSEAADALGLSDVTVRGAANGPNPRITKFPGPLVDMRECSTVFANSRRTVGA
jgi:hypothetical protein